MFEELHITFQVSILKVPDEDNILRNNSAFDKAKRKKGDVNQQLR